MTEALGPDRRRSSEIGCQEVLRKKERRRFQFVKSIV
jgi:hypothetical protein